MNTGYKKGGELVFGRKERIEGAKGVNGTRRFFFSTLCVWFCSSILLYARAGGNDHLEYRNKGSK